MFGPDWDWLWDAWDDFDLSIDWGNVATFVAAIAAIIVSSRFNVLTLRMQTLGSSRNDGTLEMTNCDARSRPCSLL